MSQSKLRLVPPSLEARRTAAAALRENAEAAVSVVERVEAIGDSRPQLASVKRKAHQCRAVANWLESFEEYE